MLQLEYRCTEAEMKEAQALQLHEGYGCRFKWLSSLIPFGFLALVITALHFRFKTDIVTTRDRSVFIAMIVVIYLVLLTFKRMTRHRKSDQLTRIEISEDEVTFSGDGARTALHWSTFGQCVESPNLFVLVDRPKAVLFVVPKRAFPDETARNWFRVQANQPRGVTEVVVEKPPVSERTFDGNEIRLTLHLNCWDYLDHNITSWRTKGIFLGLVTGIALFSTPPADAVNSPLKTSLITIPIMIAIMVFVILLISFGAWHLEKNSIGPLQIILTAGGIEFAGRDGSGRLPWSAYKYYRESRRSFFVWDPRGSVWFMFPKRGFASSSDLSRLRAMLQKNLKHSRWFYL
jgi:hypothetical protein